MRDQRSQEIKKILKKCYPDAQFKVRINKYSMGESIHIYTDLLIILPNKPVEEYTEKENIEREKSMAFNQTERERIQNLLSEFSHIDRCDITGEILSGGNTYLFVEDWSVTQWI